MTTYLITKEELEELLRKQRGLCAEYLEDSFSEHPFKLDQMINYTPSPPLPVNRESVIDWEKRWKEANQFILDLAKELFDNDELGFDGISWSIEDFKNAMNKKQGGVIDWEGLEKELINVKDFLGIIAKEIEQRYPNEVLQFTIKTRVRQIEQLLNEQKNVI